MPGSVAIGTHGSFWRKDVGSSSLLEHEMLNPLSLNIQFQ